MKEVTNEQIDAQMAQFCPFEYRDIEVALKNIHEVEENPNNDELYQICNDYCESTDTPMDKVDPVACVYDHYHQKAREDIEQATGKDICNESPYYGVNVSGNYMATTMDGTQENIDALKELINTIPEESRTPSINWLLNKL